MDSISGRKCILIAKWLELKVRLGRDSGIGRALLSLTVIGILTSGASAQEIPQCRSMHLLVKLIELTSDMTEHGGVTSDTLFVFPDGHFQLQRRKQHLPKTEATLTIYESTLDSDRLQKLQSILDESNVKGLAPYTHPAFPLNGPWWGFFEADIARDNGLQDVGYWVWLGGSSDTSPNTTPDVVRNGWLKSRLVLQPLLDWLHRVEAMHLRPSENANLLSCTSEGKEP